MQKILMRPFGHEIGGKQEKRQNQRRRFGGAFRHEAMLLSAYTSQCQDIKARKQSMKRAAQSQGIVNFFLKFPFPGFIHHLGYYQEAVSGQLVQSFTIQFYDTRMQRQSVPALFGAKKRGWEDD